MVFSLCALFTLGLLNLGCEKIVKIFLKFDKILTRFLPFRCEEVALEDVEHVRTRAEDLAAALELAPDARAELGLERIRGLEPWLAGVDLADRKLEVPRQTAKPDFTQILLKCWY